MDNRKEKARETAEQFSALYENPDKTFFTIRDGNKVYEVTTHFNTQGDQSVFQQFKDLILSEGLVSNRTFDNDDRAL